MAFEAKSLYKQYACLLDKETRALLKRGEHPFQFPGLHFVRSTEESPRLVSSPGPNIILAGSGMCTGGRIKHYLRRNIERRRPTILFVGFQAADTLGRQIVQGAKEVRINSGSVWDGRCPHRRTGRRSISFESRHLTEAARGRPRRRRRQ